ncbi:xanthine dehydrogenase molybdenum binding subunit [Escherichia coli]|nr:xanthine dehydrogenase molybdenum binding subunit [Escherichia coli]
MEAREATATGESCMRVDAIAKVTGRARYTDDYVMAGMCYAKYVRSPIAVIFRRTHIDAFFGRIISDAYE